MVQFTFIIFIFILLFLSFVVKIKRIQSKLLAYGLLFIVAFGIIVANLIKRKCDNNNSLISSQQCILGNTKLHNGLFHGGCFDIFHILHVLLWFLVGQLMPNQYLLILFLSISWETLEHFGFQYLCKTKNKFQGRVEDVIFNLLGYYLGSKF
jgi:hypothetical protein